MDIYIYIYIYTHTTPSRLPATLKNFWLLSTFRRPWLVCSSLLCPSRLQSRRWGFCCRVYKGSTCRTQRFWKGSVRGSQARHDCGRLQHFNNLPTQAKYKGGDVHPRHRLFTMYLSSYYTVEYRV